MTLSRRGFVRLSLAQAVLSQSSYYSANDPRLHFGLGSYTSVDLEGVGAVPNRGWSKA
jgi:hypothetical protein